MKEFYEKEETRLRGKLFRSRFFAFPLLFLTQSVRKSIICCFTAGFIFMGVWLQVSEIYSCQEVGRGVWRSRQLKPPAIFKPGGEIQPSGTPVSAHGIRGASSSLDNSTFCVIPNQRVRLANGTQPDVLYCNVCWMDKQMSANLATHFQLHSLFNLEKMIISSPI